MEMRKKTGFTLIEMIIVMGMTVLIMGIALSVFMTGNKVFSESDIKTTLQMEAKDIQENISEICMNSSKIILCEIDNDNVTEEPYNGEIMSNKFISISGQETRDKKWLQVSKLSLESLTKNSDVNSYNNITNLENVNISYDENTKILNIGSKKTVVDVKHFYVQPLNLNDNNNKISSSEGLKFNIILKKKKSGKTIEYTIDFTVTFRNI